MNESDKFQGKYRISSSRLQAWDYSFDAVYFITICTKKRKHFFGQIVGHEMELNELGLIASNCWKAIPEHFPGIVPGDFVIMPNHMHAVIQLSGSPGTIVRSQSAGQVVDGFQQLSHPSLANIIGSYKSAVTRLGRLINPDFGWQTRFHDHIIRNAGSLKRIQHYIITNPANWESDRLFGDFE